MLTARSAPVSGDACDQREPLGKTVHRLPIGGAAADGASGYDREMAEDPLLSALEELEPKVDPDVRPVVQALQAGESAEASWEALLKEILDEA